MGPSSDKAGIQSAPVALQLLGGPGESLNELSGYVTAEALEKALKTFMRKIPPADTGLNKKPQLTAPHPTALLLRSVWRGEEMGSLWSSGSPGPRVQG